MIRNSSGRFKGKRISDLGRMDRLDLLEEFVEDLAEEVSRMCPCPEIVVLQANELQPSGVISYFHTLLREKNIGSQVRICNGEEVVEGYVVNVDERVQEYVNTL